MLEHDGVTESIEAREVDLAFNFYDEIIGTLVTRKHSLNFTFLGMPICDLSAMDAPFSDQEIWSVIHSLPPDKAPKSDGFTTQIIQVAWLIIKVDIVLAFDALSRLDPRNFHLVNEALIVLVPKKWNAKLVKDFRPISLIHCIAKLVIKVLANRLTPHLPNMVSVNQSAFVKGHCIQDNFKYVQCATKLLHVKKLPRLLAKLDIMKPFDSVAWPFLLELMQHMGSVKNGVIGCP